MNNFNSLTEIVNAVANHINKEFILIADPIGEYTPKTWNYIDDDVDVGDGVSNPATNPLSDLPEDLISAIQAWEQDECIANLIFIPLTRESLEKHYKKLYKILLGIAQTEDDGLGDDDYYDYVPNAFYILEWILFGLAHTYDDPVCAFDALKVHYNHYDLVHYNYYDLIKAYAKFSNNTYSSDDILSLISPHSYSEMSQFNEDAQIHKL